ncbi:MAG: M6 family metalloprotease domain-containing protein [Anaerolineales bacterium]|nr:M6 family metalloprotease domain-containing protein [Anaerolineales bacterium]
MKTTFRKFLIVAFVFLITSMIYLFINVPIAEANPASPIVTMVEQPDGTMLRLRLWGDEFVNGWETLPGFTVLQNPTTGYWEYAIRNEAGELTLSGNIAGYDFPPAPPHLRPSAAVYNAAREASGAPPPGTIPHASAPPWAIGNTNVLVIMVQFPSDAGDPDGAQPAVSCTFTAADMQANLFGGTPTGPGNLTDYYNEVSYNSLNLVGTVVGCFTVANDKNDYDDGPLSHPDLFAEAIALADPTVDFAPFDNDGDGVVDQVAIAYAGGGPDNSCYQGANAGVNRLWPRASSTSAVSVDGGARSVSSYYISPELQCGATIRTIGVYAHEFGHKLGLPDLYDTDNSSEGIGHWGLMGSGSWNSNNPGWENGQSPAHLTPWSKWFLGWITPTNLTGVNITQTMPQIETNPFTVQLLSNPSGPDDWPGTGEYFLIENRQRTGFDRGLDGCGILIWHMDEARSNNKKEGHTSANHRLVDIEEADGTDPMPNRGDGGDPFPGTSGNTEFNDTTTPHSKLYDGTNTGIKVELVTTTCDPNMIVNFGDIPVADANGPYFTDEGDYAPLDATGSSHPTGDPLTYEWDFDDDGLYDDATGPTPDFPMVGQDGVYPVALKVSSNGAYDTDETTVTVFNVAPSVSLGSDTPADEGSLVTVSGTVTDPGWLDPLTATIEWGDGSPVEPVGGVLENLEPDATLTFDISHTFSDNGDYVAQVCADDDDTTTCENILLQIFNVPPTVTIDPSQITVIDEGEFIDVLAHFTDPGWADTYTSLIDWGTGETEAGNLVVTVEGPPVDQGTVTGQHQYGDNGSFPIEISVTDDDGGKGSAGFDLTVNNVPPTVEIDLSGAILINGIPTFLAHASEPIDFSGNATDPGSDDLTLSWDWDDGPPTPDVTTIYLVNPPNLDPFPSPSVQPRDVIDTHTHSFEDACMYVIAFYGHDDDGGASNVDSANVIIVGNADETRTAGYWQHQYRRRGKTDFDEDALNCNLAIVGYMSQVFNEARDASTIVAAFDVLFMRNHSGSMVEIFDRQLLAVWLNFANGSIEYDEMVDTDGDGIVDTAFADALATAEAVRLDLAATDEQLEEQKDILERINKMDE